MLAMLVFGMIHAIDQPAQLMPAAHMQHVVRHVRAGHKVRNHRQAIRPIRPRRPRNIHAIEIRRRRHRVGIDRVRHRMHRRRLLHRLHRQLKVQRHRRIRAHRDRLLEIRKPRLRRSSRHNPPAAAPEPGTSHPPRYRRKRQIRAPRPHRNLRPRNRPVVRIMHHSRHLSEDRRQRVPRPQNTHHKQPRKNMRLCAYKPFSSHPRRQQTARHWRLASHPTQKRCIFIKKESLSSTQRAAARRLFLRRSTPQRMHARQPPASLQASETIATHSLACRYREIAGGPRLCRARTEDTRRIDSVCGDPAGCAISPANTADAVSSVQSRCIAPGSPCGPYGQGAVTIATSRLRPRIARSGRALSRSIHHHAGHHHAHHRAMMRAIATAARRQVPRSALHRKQRRDHRQAEDQHNRYGQESSQAFMLAQAHPSVIHPALRNTPRE